MTQSTVTQSIDQINNALEQIIRKVKGLDIETIRWKPSEEEWSIMQILCHLLEAVPYWLKEIDHLLTSPGSEWGRGLQDQDRLDAVAHTENQSISSVLDGLKDLKTQVEIGLSKLNQENLKQEAPSRNPRFGTKPISFIVDHLLVEHVSKHYGQIQRNLNKLEAIKQTERE